MSEQVGVRDILNRTNEAFYQEFGRLAGPALLAGLIGYCLNLLYARISHRLVLALWQHFQANPDAATRPIVAGDRPVDPFRDSAQASKPWRATIVVSCLLIWGVSQLVDLHLPSVLLGPGGIRPSVDASYTVYAAVSLATSVMWAWLFAFLTEIAIVSVPTEGESLSAVPASE